MASIRYSQVLQLLYIAVELANWLGLLFRTALLTAGFITTVSCHFLFAVDMILLNKNYVFFFLVEGSNIKENEDVFSQQESSERESPPIDMDDENGSTETVEQAAQEHDGAGAQVGNLKESPIEKLLKIIAFN